MRSFSQLAFATAFVALPISAQADITPLDVWENTVESYSAMGFDLSGEPSIDGDVLTIENQTFTMKFGDMGPMEVNSTGSIGKVTLTQTRDGKVEISMPEAMTMATSVKAPIDADMPEQISTSTVKFDGVIIAEGDPNNITFRLNGGTYSILSDATQIDETFTQPASEMSYGPLSGFYTMEKSGDAWMSEMDISGETFTQKTLPSNDATTAPFMIDVTSTDAKMVGSIKITPSTDTNYMQTLLQGTDGHAVISTTSSQFNLTVIDPQTSQKNLISGTVGASDIGVGFDNGTLSYDVDTNDIKVTTTLAAMPMPLEFSMGKMGVDIKFPFKPSDDMQDFGFGIELAELVLPDMAWMMFDSANQLPRDPATLRLAANGTVQMIVDIFDADAIMEMEEVNDMPFKVSNVEISEIYLSFLGAMVEASGEGTFIEAAPELAGGMPPFAGTATAKLTGINTLMDKLTTAGLLPGEQSMMARMMLGMFAVPGDGADVLVSDLELTESGQVLANGTPLPF